MRDQRGFTLIEVLIGLLLLSLALLPALETIAVARQAALATQRRALTVGLARARISQLTSLAAASGAASLSDSTTTGDAMTGDPSLSGYKIDAQILAHERPTIRFVKVTVSCDTCKGRFGVPVQPVTLTSIAGGN